jgi:hypothetical protein
MTKTFFTDNVLQPKNTEFKVQVGRNLISEPIECEVLFNQGGKSYISYSVRDGETIYKWVDENQVQIVEK